MNIITKKIKIEKVDNGYIIIFNGMELDSDGMIPSVFKTSYSSGPSREVYITQESLFLRLQLLFKGPEE